MASDEDLEAASDLPVLDLDDTDLGVRTEDRYAAIPPGPRLVRRREHPDRDRGPAVVLLVALAVLFAVAAWLDGISSDDRGDAQDDNAVPGFLDHATGATLLAVGDDGAVEIDVDARTARAPMPLERPVNDALLGESTLVVRGSGDLVTAVSREDGVVVPLGRPDMIVPSSDPRRVWLVERSGTGSIGTGSIGREVAVADGSVTRELGVDGRIVGAAGPWVVTNGDGLLQLVDGTSAPQLVGDDLTFLASSTSTVVSRTRRCTTNSCELVIYRLGRDGQERLDLALGTGGQEAALLSPDERHVAVVRSDGLESRGVIVDLDEGTVVHFTARALANEANRPLAWSSDGAWLFVATARNGLDAVDVNGDVFRVDVELPETEALLLAG